MTTHSISTRITFFMVLLLAFSCTAQKSENVRLIDQSEYMESFAQKNHQLLDVRTAEEYAEGHIGESINIDFYADDFVARCEQEFDKSQPLVLYCKSGGRSASASEQLAEAGFQTICDIDGGYERWEK